MRGKRQLPEHIPGTMREFRQRKRKELRDAIKAFKMVWRASVFAPAAQAHKVSGQGVCASIHVLHNLNQLKKAWSQKEWGK